jgi:hypothetical protein
MGCMFFYTCLDKPDHSLQGNRLTGDVCKAIFGVLRQARMATAIGTWRQAVTGSAFFWRGCGSGSKNSGRRFP